MGKYFRNMDWTIVIPYIVLSLFGIVMVYSASAGLTSQGELANHYVLFQSIFVIIGIVVAIAFSVLNLGLILKGKKSGMLMGGLMVLMFGMLVLLIWLKFFGTSINGAAGWLHIGPLSIQPAEFCKPLFIIYFAVLLGGKEHEFADGGFLSELKTTWGQDLLPAAMLIAIFVEPDTGGFAINCFIILIMYLAADKHRKSAAAGLATIFVLFLGGGYFFFSHFQNQLSQMHDYKIQRLASFTDPFKFAQTSGHQLINSYYAMSNGGFLGVGLGNSIQKMGYLSEPNTDFIISIICEEVGFVGVVIVLCLIAILIIRIVAVAMRAENLFNQLICYGTAGYLLIQTLFNAGGACGLVPLTGVALPFISYGGSSLLSLSVCIGMVLHVSISENIKRGKNKWH